MELFVGVEVMATVGVKVGVFGVEGAEKLLEQAQWSTKTPAKIKTSLILFIYSLPMDMGFPHLRVPG